MCSNRRTEAGEEVWSPQPAENDYFDHDTLFPPRNSARHPDKADKVRLLVAGDTLERPQGMPVFEE